jgi:hypothetical protein
LETQFEVEVGRGNPDGVLVAMSGSFIVNSPKDLILPAALCRLSYKCAEHSSVHDYQSPRFWKQEILGMSKLGETQENRLKAARIYKEFFHISGPHLDEELINKYERLPPLIRTLVGRKTAHGKERLMLKPGSNQQKAYAYLTDIFTQLYKDWLEEFDSPHKRAANACLMVLMQVYIREIPLVSHDPAVHEACRPRRTCQPVG